VNRVCKINYEILLIHPVLSRVSGALHSDAKFMTLRGVY
jgi:hypothetical protein